MAAEKVNQNQAPSDAPLRRPPVAGGPRRVNRRGENAAQEQQRITRQRQAQKKSRLRRALPYLLPGLATGGTVAFSLTDFFGS